MISNYVAPIANHLWQSTLFAVLAALLALVLRKDRAALRYVVWLAASAKFLVPFSLLVSIGRGLSWKPTVSIADPGIFAVVDDISRPFTSASSAAAGQPQLAALELLPFALVAVWLFGVAIVFLLWSREMASGANGPSDRASCAAEAADQSRVLTWPSRARSRRNLPAGAAAA